MGPFSSHVLPPPSLLLWRIIYDNFYCNAERERNKTRQIYYKQNHGRCNRRRHSQCKRSKTRQIYYKDNHGRCHSRHSRRRRHHSGCFLATTAVIHRIMETNETEQRDPEMTAIALNI